MELGYTTLSLVYGTKFPLFPIQKKTPGSDRPTDFIAFSLIVYLVLVRSNAGYQRRMPLLKTIAQDATYYFLIIFTSHFVLELTLLFARVRALSLLHAFSVWIAETFIAFTTTNPRLVSDTGTHFLRFSSFTETFSVR